MKSRNQSKFSPEVTDACLAALCTKLFLATTVNLLETRNTTSTPRVVQTPTHKLSDPETKTGNLHSPLSAPVPFCRQFTKELSETMLCPTLQDIWVEELGETSDAVKTITPSTGRKVGPVEPVWLPKLVSF